MNENKRIVRERRTIDAMFLIYCRANHRPQHGLCAACQSLQAYAMDRLDHCVFKDDKPTCLSCPVHCYKKEMRAQIREVMKFAGPRMLARHPVLAVLHLIDGKKKPPLRPKRSPQE
jgi:hypothetical protein